MLYMSCGVNRDTERDRNIPPIPFILINNFTPLVMFKSSTRTLYNISQIIYLKFN